MWVICQCIAFALYLCIPVTNGDMEGVYLPYGLLGPRGKRLWVLPLQLLVCTSLSPTKLFLYGITSLGDDFTSCHLSSVFLEVGKFLLAVIGSLSPAPPPFIDS